MIVLLRSLSITGAWLSLIILVSGGGGGGRACLELPVVKRFVYHTICIRYGVKGF